MYILVSVRCRWKGKQKKTETTSSMKTATLAGLLLCGVLGAERTMAGKLSTPKYPHVPLAMWSERPCVQSFPVWLKPTL